MIKAWEEITSNFRSHNSHLYRCEGSAGKSIGISGLFHPNIIPHLYGCFQK